MEKIKVEGLPTKISYDMKYLLDMLFIWDKETGDNKDRNLVSIIKDIVGLLGKNYMDYEFFTPFLSNVESGTFDPCKKINLTKEEYLEGANVVRSVIYDVENKSGMAEFVIIYGIIAMITDYTNANITSLDKRRERNFKILESLESRGDIDTERLEFFINESKKLNSDIYVSNLNNELVVWERLVKKYFSRAF